jgi:hypothetical protein
MSIPVVEICPGKRRLISTVAIGKKALFTTSIYISQPGSISIHEDGSTYLRHHYLNYVILVIVVYNTLDKRKLGKYLL